MAGDISAPTSIIISVLALLVVLFLLSWIKHEKKHTSLLDTLEMLLVIHLMTVALFGLSHAM